MLLPLLGIWNPSWQVFGLFKTRKLLLFLRFWWFIHEFSEIYTLLFLKICYNDSRFDAVLSEISANKWADFTKKSTFHRNKITMLRRCAFPAWHFLWFWICSLIRSWLVCVVSISILCISDLILTCSRIQKKGISATFQIFSKKKKVPKNQHFFIYYPCFLDINTTHSTCNKT